MTLDELSIDVEGINDRETRIMARVFVAIAEEIKEVRTEIKHLAGEIQMKRNFPG